MKFSELTLDMFRVLQTLEREPQEDFTGTQIYDASPAPGRPPFVSLNFIHLIMKCQLFEYEGEFFSQNSWLNENYFLV